MLAQLAGRAGVTIRGLMREKGTPFAERGLADATLTDAQLLDAIEAHPILINRPLVVSPLGVRLCRPSETVLDLLPAQRGLFEATIFELRGCGPCHERGVPSRPERASGTPGTRFPILSARPSVRRLRVRG